MTFAFSSDASVQNPGWAAVITAVEPCTVNAGPDLNASTGPADCTASVQVTPTIAPAGCANGGTLSYTVAGTTTTVPVPLAGPITISGLPAGSTTITFVLRNSAGGFLDDDELVVNVSDQIDPVVTCPADIFVNLGAGECSAFVNYQVTGTDNCPFVGPATTLNTINAPNNGNASGGIVVFDLVNNTAGPLIISGMTSSIDGPTMINVYTKTGTGQGFEQNAAAWTLTAVGDATAGPFTTVPTPFAVDFSIPPGVTGVALHVMSTTSNYTNGNGGGGAYGTSPNGNYTDGTLTILAGATSNTFFASFPFNPRIWNGSVTYAAGGPAPDPTQTAGLPSGSEFPIGTTTNSFSLTDVQGNTGTCSFNVNVIAFANPTQTLELRITSQPTQFVQLEQPVH